MTVEKGDVLLHKNTGDVFKVRSMDGPYVNLYHYPTKQVQVFNQNVLDQFFTKVEADIESDLAEMGRVGPADYDSLRAVRQEYAEWKATWGGSQAPRDREPYTNAEIEEILKTDNLIAFYQLAISMDRSLTALRYVKKKAISMQPEKWEQWTEKGVPGTITYWQIQTVVKDRGGVYNPLLDQRPDLQVRT